MTRAEISGALQALNAQNVRNRAQALQPMLAAKMAPAAVNRILADLKSYPEWSARLDLEDNETAPLGTKMADPGPKKKARG